MGSCSGCLSKTSHTKELVKTNDQKREEALSPQEEIATKRQFSIGSSLPIIPDHPMANYIFPRNNTLN